MHRENNLVPLELGWLNSVPAQWVGRRIKDLAKLQSGDGITSEQINSEGLYPVYGGNGLRGYYVKYNREGDYVLIGRQGALCGNINYATGKFWASEHAVVAVLKRGVHWKWLGETLRVMNLNQHSIAAAQPGLAVDRIKHLLLPFPPVPEQHAIAKYLDLKTGAIDRKVALLERKAQFYRDIKQSLINETVTRGLDKSAPLCDSGVDWIGQIPAHWTVDRIGTAFEERSEKVSSKKYPALSVTMSGIVPQLDTAAKSKHDGNRKRVAVGDFVINSRSDRRGSSGISPLDGSVSVISIVLKPRKHFHGKYLHHLFRSYRFIEEFYRMGQGIVADLWTTRYSVMKAIEFAFPSVEEQQAIAAYLDQKCGQLDRIVETLETQIDKLKELRKTLINDVVTGKIRVTPPTDAEVV
jgi:type I restriction enzyme S subunit